MGEDTSTVRHFHSIDPGTTLAGITEQLRSLSAVFVVRRRKPPYLVRSYHEDFLAPFGHACCPCNRRRDCDNGRGCRKYSLHHLSPPPKLFGFAVVHRCTFIGGHCTADGSTGQPGGLMPSSTAYEAGDEAAEIQETEEECFYIA